MHSFAAHLFRTEILLSTVKRIHVARETLLAACVDCMCMHTMHYCEHFRMRLAAIAGTVVCVHTILSICSDDPHSRIIYIDLLFVRALAYIRVRCAHVMLVIISSTVNHMRTIH